MDVSLSNSIMHTATAMKNAETANAVQVGGSSSNSAGNAVLMQLFPVGKKIRVSLLIATSVPTNCMLSVCLYDY